MPECSLTAAVAKASSRASMSRFSASIRPAAARTAADCAPKLSSVIVCSDNWNVGVCLQRTAPSPDKDQTPELSGTIGSVTWNTTRLPRPYVRPLRNFPRSSGLIQLLLLQPSDEFHMLFPALAANEVFPIADWMTVLGLDRWKIRSRTLYRICCHDIPQNTDKIR